LPISALLAHRTDTNPTAGKSSSAPSRELEGVRLNHGALKSVTIVQTADKQDFKVVFIKGAARDAAQEDKLLDAPADKTNPVIINHYKQHPKDPLQEAAEDTVRYFHKVFHGITSHDPQVRETNQALTLVSRYGAANAKRIVDFTAAQAAKTKFSPQHFGSILAYVSRAMADATPHREESTAAERPGPVAPTTATTREPRYLKGTQRLAILTAEQLAKRMAATRAELFREIPFLAQRSRPGGKLAEDMVRTRLIRTLDTEVMDLVPQDTLKLPEPLAKILALGAEQKSDLSR
jgi:hypothetical protein